MVVVTTTRNGGKIQHTYKCAHRIRARGSLTTILTQWNAFMTMSISSTCPLVKVSSGSQLMFAVLYLLLPSSALWRIKKGSADQQQRTMPGCTRSIVYHFPQIPKIETTCERESTSSVALPDAPL